MNRTSLSGVLPSIALGLLALAPAATLHAAIHSAESAVFVLDLRTATDGGPVATTTAATGVTATGATLNASVTPAGTNTTVYFQYGTTTSYGSQTNSTSVGSGTSSQPFYYVVVNLASGATYHFRVVATNSGGTTYGADQTFTTTGPTAPPLINNQPAANTPVNSGSGTTLTVAASGTGLSYQWYRGAKGDTANPISGATSASYTTPALTATTSYWVRVSNSGGSVDSNAATVTVATVTSANAAALDAALDDLRTALQDRRAYNIAQLSDKQVQSIRVIKEKLDTPEWKALNTQLDALDAAEKLFKALSIFSAPLKYGAGSISEAKLTQDMGNAAVVWGLTWDRQYMSKLLQRDIDETLADKMRKRNELVVDYLRKYSNPTSADFKTDVERFISSDAGDSSDWAAISTALSALASDLRAGKLEAAATAANLAMVDRLAQTVRATTNGVALMGYRAQDADHFAGGGVLSIQEDIEGVGQAIRAGAKLIGGALAFLGLCVTVCSYGSGIYAGLLLMGIGSALSITFDLSRQRVGWNTLAHSLTTYNCDLQYWGSAVAALDTHMRSGSTGAAQAQAAAIEVTAVSVPDVIVASGANGAIGTARFTIRNSATSSQAVSFYVGVAKVDNTGAESLLTPATFNLSSQKAATLAASSIQTVDVPFDVPDPALWGELSSCKIVFLIGAGPLVFSDRDFPLLAPGRAFKAGNQDRVNQGRRNSVSTLSSGTIGNGAKVDTASSGGWVRTKKVTFTLSYNTGELDLQVIDNAGRMTGRNAAAGRDETSIPNSTYTGSASKPEIVVITKPQQDKYTIRVISVSSGRVVAQSDGGLATLGEPFRARAAAEGSVYCLTEEVEPESPPILAVRTPVLRFVAPVGSTNDITGTIVLSEIGGSGDIGQITLSSSGLQSAQGSSAGQLQLTQPAVLVAGGTVSAPIVIGAVARLAAGMYTGDIAVNPGGQSVRLELEVQPPETTLTSRLANLSVRTTMASGQTLIVGVVVSGGSRNVLVRAVGPALAGFGLTTAMSDPRLELYNGSNQVFANDNWPANLADTFASVGAFPLQPGGRDAAFVQSIDGARSIWALGTGPGVVLVEAYDIGTGNSPRFVNVSARNRVGTGDDILIAGFNLAGTGTKQLLIRAVGPKLGGFGVSGFLADPKLEIYSSATKLTENDNWVAALAPTFAAVGAFPLDANSRDAALVTTLAPGSYTVQVRGADGGTGEALIEIYELPESPGTSPAAAPTGFALISAGTFTMGDSLDGLKNAPAHAVTLTAFYLATTEMTKADWDDVRTWATAHLYTDLPAGAGKASTHPVQGVSWYDVVKWCNARSEKEGLTPVYYTNDAQTTVYRTGSVNVTNAQVKWTANGYRLPTEAEWEYAARGGLTGKRFPWGDTITHLQANYYSVASLAYDVSATRGYNPTYATGAVPYTNPVGAFTANGYGLFDVAGNVWEWCWDWYGTYSGSADPRGAASGSYRVLRGGDWKDNTGARTAFRHLDLPNYVYDNRGFRVARSSLP